MPDFLHNIDDALDEWPTFFSSTILGFFQVLTHTLCSMGRRLHRLECCLGGRDVGLRVHLDV